MTHRIYDFTLPQHITGIQDSVGVSDLKSMGLWNKIPADLQAKLEAADSWFSSGLDVKASDLNELPDDVWAFIADKLNLKWHMSTLPPKPSSTKV